jgi:hypothetical protein
MLQRSHSIACAIACDRMRLHEIACDRMQLHEIANLMSTTVRVLENTSGTRSGTESLPKCFFTTTVNRFHIIFFAFLKKEEMRSGTHLTQQNMFLLFTVVMTKHVWPYFQSHFPKTSSERVSSRDCGAISETHSPHVSCSPVASPFRTSAVTTLRLPLSGSQGRGCRTPIMQPPSGLRR